MFKALQVLRLNVKTQNTEGRAVKEGQRVVVVNVKDDVVKARYGDKGQYQYLTAPVSVFSPSPRGRPVGSGKKDTQGGSF